MLVMLGAIQHVKSCNFNVDTVNLDALRGSAAKSRAFLGATSSVFSGWANDPATPNRIDEGQGRTESCTEAACQHVKCEPPI